MNDTALEQHAFGAEVGRLLDLVVHSLYSEREIFLRELVANAADAMDRRRFEALTDPALAPPADAKIRLVPDKQARTLLIADDGIGMTRQELIDNLGTIARSGTRAFAQNLASAKPEDRPSLIGQFGVGFYSAFMVADRVEVTSRKAGSEEAFTWASDGAGQFTLAPATRETPGTDIVLHLARHGRERPILLLVTYRDDELVAGQPLAAILPLLVREARAARLVPSHLTAKHARDFVRSHYRLRPSDEDRLVAHLHA
ncbi:MAG: ATP-binding protein, partial [Rhodospirillales bacterium]|nr:ATP-binding protein [Rhodospirillales bacterium]